MIKFRFILFFLSLFPLIIHGQYFQKSPSGGLIDWTGQIIREIGIGFPNPNMPISLQRAGAIEAAKKVALRNLLERVGKINIHSEVYIEQYMVSSEVVRKKIINTLQNFHVIDTRYRRDGSVEVEVEVPLSGIFHAILPEQFNGSIPSEEFYSTSEASTDSMVYTGLIVNAQGFHLTPALAPKIFNEDNELVYSVKKVNSGSALQRGIVVYEKNVDKAKVNERITNNPLVVDALKTSGDNNTDVVISNGDAEKIFEMGNNVMFLQQCSVIIVSD